MFLLAGGGALVAHAVAAGRPDRAGRDRRGRPRHVGDGHVSEGRGGARGRDLRRLRAEPGDARSPPRPRPGSQPKAYRNYKELLADKDVQAVLIATPEHWHYQMVLDALAAGKDVYVEKPLCQTPEQGVALVEAEKKTKSIMQVGMQRRCYDLYQEGREIVAAGELGSGADGALVVAEQLPGRAPPRSWTASSIGSSGRVRRRAATFDPDRFRNWRFYSDYAGGILADQGAHVFDGIHMLMNAGYPLAVTAAAGKPHKAGRGSRRNRWWRPRSIPRTSSASSASTTRRCSIARATIS